LVLAVRDSVFWIWEQGCLPMSSRAQVCCDGLAYIVSTLRKGAPNSVSSKCDYSVCCST
jgi:hypothetical protein